MNTDEAATPTVTTPSAGAAWLSVRDAAAALCISPRSVRRQCAAGALPSRRVGSVWQVQADAAKSDKSDINGADKSDTDSNVKSDRPDTGAAKSRTSRTESADKSDTDLTAHLLKEVRFLRAALEQRDRDAAEIRAALRAALKLSAGEVAPQLTQGATDAQQSARTGSASNHSHASASAPDWSSIYGQIADELEAQEQNR